MEQRNLECVRICHYIYIRDILYKIICEKGVVLPAECNNVVLANKVVHNDITQL